MKSTRLKDLIKNQSSEISFEEYRVRYATERFLLRLQESAYKDNFVIKGGFLLGAMFKVEQRTTKDLDTLLKGIVAEKEILTKILERIIRIELEDGVQFELINLTETQQERIYDGFRAKLKMIFLEEKTVIQFDLDIGVGDAVTPKAEMIDIPLLFNEKKGEHKAITLYAYPIATIFAEKAETILNLGIKNSRMKDFYDIHLILNDQKKPNLAEFYEAFVTTWQVRHKELPIDDELFEDWFFTVDEIITSREMNDVSWKNYIRDREYAKGLELKSIVHQFKDYLEQLYGIYKDRENTKL